jgi:proline iminopeptidase
MHRTMKSVLVFTALALALTSCTQSPAKTAATTSYFDNTGRDDIVSGGVKMIPIRTPKGTFHVWTKRVGNNPRIKVLLLHGGPGCTHEQFEIFDSFFPGAGIEYYYYDQLGSWYSDQPKDSSLWNLPRFVEEVEEVRQALHLTHDNFYLYGQSWGGLLAIEYALQYQQHLKGLIISNMMASCPAYGVYAQKVLAPQMDPAVLAEIRHIEATKTFDNPRYMELLIPNHYEKHVLRKPQAEWPDPVQRMFKHLNPDVYVPMQGPSEFGVSGSLEKWDRSADLGQIAVPTLVIGAKYDTMDPAYMEMMSKKVQKGRYLYCPNSGHFAQYDDPDIYFTGLTAFLHDVDEGKF